ncbi:uncharacterized protein N7477_002489 [Penicillium maclennaniae]|uniref:uncharacterized protein n=1 Tax=Penicillium maclennaniae TaxID=1343394 RepID=UPI00254219BC|nr:uncharacterized protein N7477_002489 [Penicillium maclennaniae]KAJ5676856.1 hypothetical protein N7477_002489 [Penicillium maclennaniae]
MEAVPGPCYTCRNRRIQCDQTGVPCVKCEKAGLECLDKRPFRWVKGVAIRGKMQGRSYENAGPSFTAEHASVSAKARRALIRSSQGRLHRSNNTLGTAPSIPFSLQDPSKFNLDQASKYYIDYYDERICKLFIVYDSDKNPFRSLIPLGMKDPVLMKALLALAARHHANTGQSFYQLDNPTSPSLINANRDALLFKHQAMEALSHSLRDKRLSVQDSTVASIFLLIFLDLLESGSDGWNFHLEGAKNLIASTYKDFKDQAVINHGPGGTVRDIRDFIMKQIYLIETLGAAFLRPKMLSQAPSFDQHESQLQETIEKSFLGCSEYILMAIQQLSMERDSIAGSRPLDSESVEIHIQSITALLELIRNFDSYAWASKVQESRASSPQEIANLCTLSEAYKLGALLYGTRILDSVTGEFTEQDDKVVELSGLADSLKNDEAMFKCVLWPIFVAGLESQWQAQRDFLVGCMERFWEITRCLNAINATNILQEYWQQKSSPGDNRSEWIFNIGRLGRDWLWI